MPVTSDQHLNISTAAPPSDNFSSDNQTDLERESARLSNLQKYKNRKLHAHTSLLFKLDSMASSPVTDELQLINLPTPALSNSDKTLADDAVPANTFSSDNVQNKSNVVEFTASKQLKETTIYLHAVGKPDPTFPVEQTAIPTPPIDTTSNTISGASSHSVSSSTPSTSSPSPSTTDESEDTDSINVQGETILPSQNVASLVSSRTNSFSLDNNATVEAANTYQNDIITTAMASDADIGGANRKMTSEISSCSSIIGDQHSPQKPQSTPSLTPTITSSLSTNNTSVSSLGQSHSSDIASPSPKSKVLSSASSPPSSHQSSTGSLDQSNADSDQTSEGAKRDKLMETYLADPKFLSNALPNPPEGWLPQLKGFEGCVFWEESYVPCPTPFRIPNHTRASQRGRKSVLRKKSVYLDRLPFLSAQSESNKFQSSILSYLDSEMSVHQSSSSSNLKKSFSSSSLLSLNDGTKPEKLKKEKINWNYSHLNLSYGFTGSASFIEEVRSVRWGVQPLVVDDPNLVSTLFDPAMSPSTPEEEKLIPPHVWDIDVNQFIPVDFKTSYEVTVEVPESVIYRRCHACHASGITTCPLCLSSPLTPCGTCKSSGTNKSGGICSGCNGLGCMPCELCKNSGKTKCVLCRGWKAVRWFVVLRVVWQKHSINLFDSNGYPLSFSDLEEKNCDELCRVDDIRKVKVIGCGNRGSPVPTVPSLPSDLVANAKNASITQPSSVAPLLTPNTELNNETKPIVNPYFPQNPNASVPPNSKYPTSSLTPSYVPPPPSTDSISQTPLPPLSPLSPFEIDYSQESSLFPGQNGESGRETSQHHNQLYSDTHGFYLTLIGEAKNTTSFYGTVKNLRYVIRIIPVVEVVYKTAQPSSSSKWGIKRLFSLRRSKKNGKEVKEKRVLVWGSENKKWVRLK